MRELTIQQGAERIKTGKSVVWVLEIDYPGGTWHFGTRRVTISGQLYDDKLVRFRDGGKYIKAGAGLNTIGSAEGFDFTIRSLPEDDDRFSDLILANGLDGFVVRFGFVFIPPGVNPITADICWYHTYLVDDYTVRSDAVEVKCIDLGLFKLDRDIVEKVTEDEFPLAPSESFGREIPLILGAVKDCPAIAVDSGARGVLDGSLIETETLITLVSVDDFPDPGAGGYQVQIGSERILVREIDRTNRTFGTSSTPCERGYGGTVAGAYMDGTSVYEIQTSYLYLMSGHKLHGISNVRVGERAISSGWESYYDAAAGRHYLRFTEKPLMYAAGPGSSLLVVDGSLDEDKVTKLFSWQTNGDNTAENAGNVYDTDNVQSFAKLIKGKLLSVRLLSDLSGGASLYGRYKKCRLKIEYFCSKRWGDQMWPYFWVMRNGAGVGTAQFLQRPPVEDTAVEVDDHDHQENSDWTIGDSKGLFAVNMELDRDLKDAGESTGWFERGQYWAKHVFTGLTRTDGTYKIQAIRWYCLFDGYPLTALMRITLKNGKFYEKYYSSFAVPEEKYIEIKKENVGEVLFADIIAGNVIFRVEGTYTASGWISIGGRVEVNSKLWMQGQETSLGQTKNKAKTELVGVNGETATSRVVQRLDYSVDVRDAGGWGFFNGTIDFKLWFNNPSLNDDTEIYIINVWWEIEHQPWVESIDSGEILADVEGWESGGGIYYDHPVDILRYILLDYYGGLSAYIDTITFDAVRSAVGAIVSSVGRWVGDRRTLKELVESLLSDINCRLIFEGLKFYLRQKPAFLKPSDSVMTITDAYFGEKILEKRRSSLMDLFNQLAIYYNRNPGKEWFRRCQERNDEESQGENWGLRRETYDAWWHGESNTNAVAWLGDRLLSCGAWKYNLVGNTGPLNLVHLERADVVQLTHERSGLVAQVAEVVQTRIEGLGKYYVGLAFFDSKSLFQTEYCRVEVDRAGGGWMKFFSHGELLAILYDSGDFHFKYKFNMAGTSMLKGNDPAEGELFVCQLLGGGVYALRVPLPASVGQCWHPMAVIGSIGVVRLFGARVRMDVANLSETIGDYVEWETDNWVKLAPDGEHVAAKFEAKGPADPDYPGVWTFKGSLKERAL